MFVKGATWVQRYGMSKPQNKTQQNRVDIMWVMLYKRTKAAEWSQYGWLHYFSSGLFDCIIADCDSVCWFNEIVCSVWTSWILK